MEEERKSPVGTEIPQQSSTPCDVEMSNGEVRVLSFFSVIVYSEVWYLLLFYCVFYLLSWVLHELLAVTRDGCSGQFSCVLNIL